LVACLALYALVMAGVRFYAQKIGVVGGLLTIVGMYIAVCCYECATPLGETIATANSQAAEDDFCGEPIV
jgi:hypothetical protein